MTRRSISFQMAQWFFKIHAHRIFDIPRSDVGADVCRDRDPRHVNHDIKVRLAEVLNALWEMVLKVEILCCHGPDSIRGEAGGGCETGAGRDDDVAAISAGERLGHLTTARIS